MLVTVYEMRIIGTIALILIALFTGTMVMSNYNKMFSIFATLSIGTLIAFTLWTGFVWEGNPGSARYLYLTPTVQFAAFALVVLFAALAGGTTAGVRGTILGTFVGLIMAIGGVMAFVPTLLPGWIITNPLPIHLVFMIGLILLPVLCVLGSAIKFGIRCACCVLAGWFLLVIWWMVWYPGIQSEYFTILLFWNTFGTLGGI